MSKKVIHLDLHIVDIIDMSIIDTPIQEARDILYCFDIHDEKIIENLARKCSIIKRIKEEAYNTDPIRISLWT